MVNPVHLLTYRFSQGWSKALDNFYSLLKQNIKSCNAKRRRQRERWKNNSRYNKQKINFARAAPFFLYISSPLFWMTATWNFQKLPSYTFYGRNVGRVLFSVFFFFHCRSFSPWWPLASRRNKISYCSSNKKCPLLYFFFSRSSSSSSATHTDCVGLLWSY